MGAREDKFGHRIDDALAALRKEVVDDYVRDGGEVAMGHFTVASRIFGFGVIAMARHHRLIPIVTTSRARLHSMLDSFWELTTSHG